MPCELPMRTIRAFMRRCSRRDYIVITLPVIRYGRHCELVFWVAHRSRALLKYDSCFQNALAHKNPEGDITRTH